MPCGYWPVPANNAPKKITAAGSGPIVVVGTTRDPATPYKWAQSLAAELQNGHLITYDGDGHTAYMRSNSCVDDAVDAYLVKGVVPPRGLKCRNRSSTSEARVAGMATGVGIPHDHRNAPASPPFSPWAGTDAAYLWRCFSTPF